MREGEVDRLAALERSVAELVRRVDALEAGAAPRAVAREAARSRPSSPPPPSPPPPPPSEAPPPRPVALPERPFARRDLEELLGGRVLAWVGATAILLGVVFFLVMAVRRGWIDESSRTVLAALGSAALVGFGVWLHERRGQTEAARAAVACGLAGLFATLVVATQVYDLVAAPVGLAAAGVVGAVGAAIAVRWGSAVVGAIGIVGALLAPVLVDAGTSDGTLAFMAVALLAAVAVLLWQQWNWLALVAFAVSMPQLVTWLLDEYEQRLALALGVLVVFWAIYVVAAIGYELRARSPEALPVASWLLLAADAVLLGGGGYGALSDTGHDDLAIAWLLVAAVLHIGLGVAVLRQAVNREIGSLLVAAGLVLSALAFADALGGPVLVGGWAVQAVLLAYLARRAGVARGRLPSSEVRLSAAAAVYAALAVGHVLAFEAPPDALRYGVDSLAKAVAAIVLAGAAAFGVAWLRREQRPDLAPAGVITAAAAVVYAPSVAIVDLWGVSGDEPRQLGQLLLSGFWTCAGLAAVVAGLLRDLRPLRLAGLSLLGLAIAKVFLYDLRELEELYRVLSFIALGLLLLGGAFAYGRTRVAARAQEER